MGTVSVSGTDAKSSVRPAALATVTPPTLLKVPPSRRVPASTLVKPEYVLRPATVAVPAPRFTTSPNPPIPPVLVKSSARSSTSRDPTEPSVTSPTNEPELTPSPTVKLPSAIEIPPSTVSGRFTASGPAPVFSRPPTARTVPNPWKL